MRNNEWGRLSYLLSRHRPIGFYPLIGHVQVRRNGEVDCILLQLVRGEGHTGVYNLAGEDAHFALVLGDDALVEGNVLALFPMVLAATPACNFDVRRYIVKYVCM